MSDRRRKILELITAKPAIQLREIAQELGMAVSTAHFYFTELRQSGAIVKSVCEHCGASVWVPSTNGGRKKG